MRVFVVGGPHKDYKDRDEEFIYIYTYICRDIGFRDSGLRV